MDNIYDLIIVGLGPSGIAAALEASKIDNYKVICIDQGLPVDSRRVNSLHGVSCKCHDRNKCDVLSGFGGASLISGTKLSDFPAGSGLVKITDSEDLIKEKTNNTLKYFDDFLSLNTMDKIDKEEAKTYYSDRNYTHKHYESYSFNEEKYSDMLKKIYAQLSKDIEIKFSTKMIDISINDGGFYEIGVEEKQGYKYKLVAKKIIIATGKSGYKNLSILSKKLNFSSNNSYLEVGLRLEFPANIFNDINKYQDDLKLISGRSRTYCVSKYGEVVSYSDGGKYFTEGRIRKAKKTLLTNLAILLRLPASSKNIVIYDKIMENYSHINNGNILTYSYDDFISHNSSLSRLFPEDIYIELHKETKKFIETFFSKEDFSKINIYCLEQDFPVCTYEVKENFEIIDNLYIIGAATGLFRGIVQSFVSGVICGENMQRAKNI